MDRKPIHAGRDDTPLQPPRRHLHRAGWHFVERIDYDGRTCGLEVYQWQPQAQKWCRPNEYASNRDIDLVNYRWVAECHLPLFPDEIEPVQAVLEDMRQRFTSGNSVPVTRTTISAEQMEVLVKFIRPYLGSPRT